MKGLEDELLEQLSSAEGDVLGDKRLVENLESSKKMATEIIDKVRESKQATIRIDEAREYFRPVATRASILYFIINDLHKINPIYQFSLKVLEAFEINFILRTELKIVINAFISNLVFQ